jgi:hypothetical protein
MKFATLHKISNLIGARRYKAAATQIGRALDTEPGPDWNRHLGRLALFLRDPAKAPFASILAEGNGKLPFLAFSVLPGVSCPGAGDCLNWCYSFKSWRYPAAFARQAQNLVLIRETPAAVFSAFDKYRGRGEVDFRLYVDGDFDSVETVDAWFDFIADNSWLAVYGYSKSLAEIKAAKKAPNNYKLNLSSGSNHSPKTLAAIRALPVTRGEFIAVDLGRPVKSSQHGERWHQAELRAAHYANTGRRSFTCPGQCGSCTPIGHACGSNKFKNVDIIIAAH